MRTRVDANYSQKKKALYKQAFIWTAYTIIAAVGLLLIWHRSDWIKDCAPIVNLQTKQRKEPNVFERIMMRWHQRPVKPKRPSFFTRVMDGRRKPQKRNPYFDE